MSERTVTIYINEYRPEGTPDDVEWTVEIGVDPSTGAIKGEREFSTVGEAAEWAVKWLRDRGFDSPLLIQFNAARTAVRIIPDEELEG